MEVIIGIIFIFVIFGVINVVASGAKAGAKATYSAATGKTTFSEGFKDSFLGMQELQIRVIEDTQLIGEDNFEVYRVQAKGIIPFIQGMDLTFSTSIIDTTDEISKPVICLLDTFQEKQSRVYLNQRRYGVIDQEMGWAEWSEVGIAIKSTLVAPKTGYRDFTFITQISSTSSSNSINMTVIPDQVLWAQEKTIEHYNKEKGYMDLAEDAYLSEEATIKLAFHIATIDGELHKKEGEYIKEWMQRAIGSLEGEKRETRKENLNNSLEEANNKFKTGMTTNYVNKQIKILIDKGTKIDHFECIELLYDVMSSDGKAHTDELKFVKDIAKQFDIDNSELALMREKRMLHLDDLENAEDDLEQILGIDTTMSKEEILEQLTNMFTMWNSRIESLDQPNEKESAQRMLDLIGEARKKYS
tara:strand:+ start:193 stop:1437 length:1245 start_codon:yes stop_codon:yes gene_type:complete